MTVHRHTGQRLRNRGVAVVEFAMVLPILVVMLFGVVELGRILFTRQVLVNVSREAANLASRGTALEDAISAIQASAAPLDLAADGYVILSEVRRDGNNNLFIHEQRASGSNTQASQVGSGAGNPATLPPAEVPIPPAGLSLYVAEVFYHAEAITPLHELVGSSFGEFYYDIAYF